MEKQKTIMDYIWFILMGCAILYLCLVLFQ